MKAQGVLAIAVCLCGAMQDSFPHALELSVHRA